MGVAFKLPELGENIDTATVVEVFVAAGDAVKVDQPLLSLETDKAEFELPAEQDGTIEEVLVKAGDEVKVGQVVVKFTDGGSKGAAVGTDTAKDSKPRSAQPEQPSQPQATSKAAAKTPSELPNDRQAVVQAGATHGDDDNAGKAIAAAPSVRRLARELGVALPAIAEALGRSRLTSVDVERFAQGGAQTAATGYSGGNLLDALPDSPLAMLLKPVELPDFSKWGEIEIEDMSKIRRRTAENMSRAWVEIPQVTHHDEADITEVDEMRKGAAERVKKAGGHLTWTAILIGVVARRLRDYPQFNASVDMVGRRIIYKKYIHMGVAVDTDRGLLVPVIHDADKKDVVAISKELGELSEAARSRNIKPDMMAGATFTITNLGGIGGSAFSPIVNPPQTAILGVSRGSIRPVWIGDEFVPRNILPLTLSYDHRIIDGADAARFTREVCTALEAADALNLGDA